MPKLYREIGKRIDSECSKRRLTHQDVGRIVGMSRPGAANLRGGKGRILLEHLYNLGAAINVPVRTFLP